jgi:hypothetical protein
MALRLVTLERRLVSSCFPLAIAIEWKTRTGKPRSGTCPSPIAPLNEVTLEVVEEIVEEIVEIVPC